MLFPASLGRVKQTRRPCFDVLESRLLLATVSIDALDERSIWQDSSTRFYHNDLNIGVVDASPFQVQATVEIEATNGTFSLPNPATTSFIGDDDGLDATSLTVTDTIWALHNIKLNGIIFTPSANFSGEATLSLTVSNGTSVAQDTILIRVNSINHAPVLDPALNPILRAIKEDTRNPYGTPVRELLAGVSDVDANAKRGLAVLWVGGTASGTWQYTLDNGANWQAVGNVSNASALLLSADGNLSRIRFVPKANFNGSVQLGYRAWDQTQGTAGSSWNLSASGSRGGTTAFSTAAESAMLRVTPVNDAPVLAINGTVGYKLNAAAVLLVNQSRVIDIDSPNFQGGSLRLSITSGADSGNRLQIGGAFTRFRNEIRLDGTTIATINAGGGVGTTDLVLKLNRNATPVNVQQLLRSITFRTVGGNSTTQRVVSFSLTDGDGGTSVTKTRMVNVRA